MSSTPVQSTEAVEARRGRRGVPLVTRIAAAICRRVLSILASVRVEIPPGLPRTGPLIVVANHISNADPPLVVGWLTPALDRQLHILAKQSIFVGPLGVFLRSQGVTPVRAGGSDIEAYRAARAVLEAGDVLCIFPEGTRSPTGVLGEPKPGVAMLATRLAVTVLPVGISGSDRFLGRGRRIPRLRAPITLRVGQPFTLEVDPAKSRREQTQAASVEIMRRIAELVEPRHRGRYQSPIQPATQRPL